MSTVSFLPRDGLDSWLKALAGERRVLAPVEQGGAVVFAPVLGAGGLVLDRPATQSPKGAVFPQTEELLRFRFERDPETGRSRVTPEASITAQPTVIFGIRPCDARGLAVLDGVFTGGEVADPYYAARRAATALVILACDGPLDEACFCHWTGGPCGTDGADVLLFPLANGYAVEAVTELGRELLAVSQAVPDADLAGELAARTQTAREAMGPAPDLAGLPEAFNGRFEDAQFWDDLNAACVSCGACAYVCPTCQCFNITDERQGAAGRRLRTWDNCMAPTFTLEASGHNPRTAKSGRYRQRLGHKFVYHPMRHGGEISCTGCGRCIRACPACMDIRRAALSLLGDCDD